jgi:hypothetical protein
LASFAVFAAALRVSDVCTPNRFVKRSDAAFRVDQLLAPREERVTVITDFEVQLRLGRRVFHVAPHAQRASISWYLG